MAIIKDVPTEYGFCTTYHKVGRLEINWHDKYATIYVYSFFNKEAREDNKYQIVTTAFDFNPSTFPFALESINILAEAYSVLKTKEMFWDAVDDI